METPLFVQTGTRGRRLSSWEEAGISFSHTTHSYPLLRLSPRWGQLACGDCLLLLSPCWRDWGSALSMAWLKILGLQFPLGQGIPSKRGKSRRPAAAATLYWAFSSQTEMSQREKHIIVPSPSVRVLAQRFPPGRTIRPKKRTPNPSLKELTSFATEGEIQVSGYSQKQWKWL